jgi:hypothetical protein
LDWLEEDAEKLSVFEFKWNETKKQKYQLLLQKLMPMRI